MKRPFFSFFVSSLILYFPSLISLEIQGHRGARGFFPENTLPGFIAAVEAGVDTLELDLHLTADQVVVIHHDFFIRRELCDCGDPQLLTASKPICQIPLTKIKAFDCGSKADADFPQQKQIPGTPIPTLRELLDWIQESNHPHAKTVRLNLEIKRDPRHPENSAAVDLLVKAVVQQIQASHLRTRVTYSSFDPEVLQEVLKLDPKASLGMQFDDVSLAVLKSKGAQDPLTALISMAARLSIGTLFPSTELLKDLTLIQAWQSKGFKVIPWTVNAVQEGETLIEAGVDGLITDYPQDFLQKFKN